MHIACSHEAQRVKIYTQWIWIIKMGQVRAWTYRHRNQYFNCYKLIDKARMWNHIITAWDETFYRNFTKCTHFLYSSSYSLWNSSSGCGCNEKWVLRHLSVFRVEDEEISQQELAIRAGSCRLTAGKLYVREVRILIHAYHLAATNENAGLRSRRQVDAFVAKCFWLKRH